MADASIRISLVLDAESYKRLQELKERDKIKGYMPFIREAIHEKLERMDGEEGIDRLLKAYNALNDNGREWLTRCAEIGAHCDETRIIVRRKRKPKE